MPTTTITKGIYCINFSNGKKYIGMSNNISQRIKEHQNDAKNGNILPVHKAMLKYSYSIEILEDCDILSRKEMGEREKYWIALYQTNNKKNGYNLTCGGDGAACGTQNSSAKLNEKQLEEVYNLLLYHKEYYIYQIANKYNISSEAISDINCGKRYFNEFLNYPLREQPIIQQKTGINNSAAIFSSEELINQVYKDLEKSSLTLQEIAKKYNVSYTTISNINRGIHYVKENQNYPIRQDKKNKKISLETFYTIINLLINTNLSYAKIADQVNLHKSTIYRINVGSILKNESFIYPIRANKEINKAVSTILASEEQECY